MKINLSVFCVIILTSAFGQKQLPDCLLTEENWEAEIGTNRSYQKDTTLVLIDLVTGKPIKSSRIVRWEILIDFDPNGKLKSISVSQSDKKYAHFIEHIRQDTHCVGKRNKVNEKTKHSYISSLANPGKKFIKYWDLTITELTGFCWPYGQEE